MARQVNYVKGTVVTSAFMNSIQEVESGLAVGIRLERASGTQITLKPVSDGSAGGSQSSLIVNGQPRWFTAAITKTCEGAKGTYSVYVTAGETTTLEAANVTVSTGAHQRTRARSERLTGRGPR